MAVFMGISIGAVALHDAVIVPGPDYLSWFDGDDCVGPVALCLIYCYKIIYYASRMLFPLDQPQ